MISKWSDETYRLGRKTEMERGGYKYKVKREWKKVNEIRMKDR